MVQKLVRQLPLTMELDIGEYDARVSLEQAPCVQVLISIVRGVLKRKGKVSIHCSAGPNSAEMLMKTIVSVNQLSISRAVLTWYLERRSEGDNFSSSTRPQHFTGPCDKPYQTRNRQIGFIRRRVFDSVQKMK